MREMVEKILSAEAEAKDRVEAARKEAAAIRSEADLAVERRLQEARKAAQEKVRDIVAAAREQGRREQESLVREAKEAGQRFIQEHAGAIEETIARVVGRITRPEYAED